MAMMVTAYIRRVQFETQAQAAAIWNLLAEALGSKEQKMSAEAMLALLGGQS